MPEGGEVLVGAEIPQNRERYADIWGTVPQDLGAYDVLADELLDVRNDPGQEAVRCGVRAAAARG